MDPVVEKLERNILKEFFELVTSTESLDNSISDSIIVRKTQNKLKSALKGAIERCTCAKSNRGVKVMCETCQGSDDEMVYLRNFYQVIRKAKKHNLTSELLQEIISTTKSKIN